MVPCVVTFVSNKSIWQFLTNYVLHNTWNLFQIFSVSVLGVKIPLLTPIIRTCSQALGCNSPDTRALNHAAFCSRKLTSSSLNSSLNSSGISCRLLKYTSCSSRSASIHSLCSCHFLLAINSSSCVYFSRITRPSFAALVSGVWLNLPLIWSIFQ